MSCICEYINTTTETSQKLLIYPSNTYDEHEEKKMTLDQPTADKPKVEKILDASDLARTCAENWWLKKKLFEYEIAIDSLEQLVTTIVNKQHEILAEMYHLRAENSELKTQCHQQREYHTMERNALIKELHDIHILYTQKSQLAMAQKKQQQEQQQSPQVEEASDNETESSEEQITDSESGDPSEASASGSSSSATDSEEESSEDETEIETETETDNESYLTESSESD